jgi:hypothetical protein
LGPVMASDSPVLRGWYMLIWVNFQWVETKIQSIGTLNRLWTLREGNGEREIQMVCIVVVYTDMDWYGMMSSDVAIWYSDISHFPYNWCISPSFVVTG